MRESKQELILSVPLRGELDRHVTEGHPHEVCGLLIGSGDGRRTTVEIVATARNLNQDRAHDRYELDPQDFMAADQAARDAGLDIVGIWHSHPDCPAVPSVTDLEAAWEGYSYLIVTATAAGATSFRSWRLKGEEFEEERIAP